ncbi:hypothetical protein LEN26_005650 [Aphanomyces euteiches]|nr:hypothetical protein AeMF1_009855 [Aphanomyces euteiches]KAH9137628.1 hypothetical protein LEN26_005650 [Aphanomyces euteiches]
MDLPRGIRDATALCWAAGTGNTDLVRKILAEGANVNVADYDQRTPLHIAASDGRVEVVEMLLQAGASVYAKDRWGVTPIDCAKDATIAALLAKHSSNAPFRRAGSLNDSFDPSRRIGMESIQNVFSAIAAGDTETLKRAWLDGLTLDKIDNMGRTALHVAVEKEQLNAVELLLSAGASVDIVDHQGRTPMSLAVDMNNANVLSLFRIHAQPTSMAHASDIPLAFDAAQRGDTARLQQLVPKLVQPNVQDYDSRTLLHVAASEGMLSAVEYLIACGANVNALDRWNNSPLSEAMYFAHNDVARYLRSHHASEHGHAINTTSSELDPTTLSTAMELILRCVCKSRWQLGEVFVPLVDTDNTCVIVQHSVWYRAERATSNVSPSSLTAFRKARGLMLFDPSQGHIGRVYSTQQPEWISNLHMTSQSVFFFAPHARRAGLRSLFSVPMMHKMSVLAVLSWYSTEDIPESPEEIHSVLRFVKSVTVLCALRNESDGMSRFQFCQALESALTGQGELVADTTPAEEIILHVNVVSLAITWNLFNLITTLATSMSSEDHCAVVHVLHAIVELVKRGAFDDVLQADILDVERQHLSGPITSEVHLLRHVVYYLAYLTSVSPTEGIVLTKSTDAQNKLRQAIRSKTSTEETKTISAPLQPEANVDNDCVLCKFNVQGHIHPGRVKKEPVAASPPTNTGSLFSKVPSPVFIAFQQLPRLFAEEFDRFSKKARLVNRAIDSFRTTRWSTSDLYDTVGSSHDKRTAFSAKRDVSDRQDVLSVMNSILEDTSAVITCEQIKALHQAILLNEGGGGVPRHDMAVGYASERIYRVFMPAVEIQKSLDEYVHTLNDPSAFPHPLVRAYYAFAALVFYIHPFYDGNGRCARLLGNILARKHGFPNGIRHLDKTIQLSSFLETSLHLMDLHEEAQRNRRNRLNPKNTSTWF